MASRKQVSVAVSIEAVIDIPTSMTPGEVETLCKVTFQSQWFRVKEQKVSTVMVMDEWEVA